MHKFGLKMPCWVFLIKNALFGYFSARIKKRLLSYLKSAPSNLYICKILQKQKWLNLGQKMPHLHIFGQEF